jgi:hypothetical protein
MAMEYEQRKSPQNTSDLSLDSLVCRRVYDCSTNVSGHGKQAAMDSRVLRKTWLVLALSGVIIGRQLLSVWAHAGHSHGDASEVEDTPVYVH